MRWFGTFLLLSAFSLCGCVRVYDTHGNFIEDEKLALLKPGMSQGQVAMVLGTPTMRAPFDEHAWFYIGEKESHVAFFAPRVEASKTVKVQFDDLGQMTHVTSYDPAERQRVAVSSLQTKDLSHNRTLVRRLFGNVGRFNKGGSPDAKPRVPGR